MSIKDEIWNEEYRKKYYSSDKVKAHLDRFVEQASKPKTESQKIKMSIAKTGRKYSDQHKQNMSETQKFRQNLRREIEASQPDLPSNLVWSEVKNRMYSES